MKSAPLPRPHLLGARPFEPAGEHGRALAHTSRRGGGTGVDTFPLMPAWESGGYLALSLLWTGVFHTNGEGQHCRLAPPPSSGVAAGPRLPHRAGRGRGPAFPPLAKVRVPNRAQENDDRYLSPNL